MIGTLKILKLKTNLEKISRDVIEVLRRYFLERSKTKTPETLASVIVVLAESKFRWQTCQ
jgi:hypothetical protein